MYTLNEYEQHLRHLQLRHPAFGMQLSFPLVCMVLGQIQLALRHPMNNGHSAKEVRNLAEAIIKELDKLSPGFGKILDMGFDPRCDVQRNALN